MVFNIVDLEQATEEWKSWRRFKIGASDCAAIMGDCPWTTPLQLYEEKMEGVEKRENEAMRRGRNLEPIALEWVNSKLGSNYKPVCVESNAVSYMIASLDGYDPDAQIPILEIKNGNKALHAGAAVGDIPINYQWQLQHQMFVTGANNALFCSFYNGEGIMVSVPQEPHMWQQLYDACKEFHARLMNMDPPKPCDRDVVDIANTKLLNMMAEYQTLELSFKEHEKRMEELKKGIIAHLDECGIKRANIGLKRVIRTMRAGAVKYKEIPELQGIDLNKYRSAPVTVWSFHERRDMPLSKDD